MLSPSVHLRLFGLAAGASLVAAAVAYVRTDGPLPAKSPVAASRPAPAAPAPEPPQAPMAAPAAPDLTAPAAARPLAPSASEPATGSIPAAAPPQAAPEVPPSARAALVDRAPRSGRLDLNTASVAELNGLRGAGRIGRRIVKHRPYRSPEDLLRKRVISRTAYAKIKDQVRVGRD